MNEYISPVWCCEKKHKCTWQGYALHKGLAWGSPGNTTAEWRRWHEKECGGRLIQLIEKQDKQLLNKG